MIIIRYCNRVASPLAQPQANTYGLVQRRTRLID